VIVTRAIVTKVLLALYSLLALQSAAQPPSPPVVRRTRLLTMDGGRVDWSGQNRIAFDRRGADGFYQIWVIDADGAAEHCLTCGQLAAPRKNKGNPAWDPSGRYIVFEGQKDRTLPFLNHLAEPGRGVANDLWLMDAAGRQYWKLVDVPRLPAGGVLHPHFSNDGTKLQWTQLLKGSGKLGIWEMRVANFQVVNGQPRITDIRSFTPGLVKKFYETHGFSPDNRRILFTAQVDTGLSDIFTMDLETEQTENLTSTPLDWDEHAQFRPDGRYIVWASSRNRAKDLNLWIMNSDGSEPRLLMDFHQPGAPAFSTGIGPADCSWSPDGKSLAVYVIGDERETKGEVWILDFN
jgi:Tol biopolymer transport system component